MNQILLGVLGVVVIAIIIFASLIISVKLIRAEEEEDSRQINEHNAKVMRNKMAAGYMLMGFSIILIISILITIAFFMKKKYISEIETYPDYGYTFYLDGNEIDISNIDINMYDISIDDKLKRVYLH